MFLCKNFSITMSETDKSKNTNNSSDEIDLRELFSSVGNFFSKTFLNFVLLIVGIKNAIAKNIKMIFILGLIGGFVGIAIHFLVPKYYESSIILKSTYMNNIMESSVEKLDLLTEDEDRGSLSKTLDIDGALAKNIVGFRFEPFLTEEAAINLQLYKERLKGQIEDPELVAELLDQLSGSNNSTYRVFVQVNDKSVVTSLEEPLLNYFSNIPYVKKRLEINDVTLKKQYAQLEAEESELDSLKELVFENFKMLGERNRDGSNNVILADQPTTSPLSVFSESRQAYAKKLSIERELFIQPEFELIDGFTVYSEPANLGLIKLGFFGGLGGLGLAFLIIIFTQVSKYLDKIEQKAKQAKDGLKRGFEAAKA